jgi:hypothetical protein
LTALGVEAIGLLCSGNTDALAERFGYALSYGREPAAAIREELTHCLGEIGATSLVAAPTHPAIEVKYFERNDSNLLAVVECVVPADNRSEVLVELIVTGDASAPYVTLEHISAVV